MTFKSSISRIKLTLMSLFITAAAIHSCSSGSRKASGAIDETTPQDTVLTVKGAVEMAQQLGMGWNLGNQMDAQKDGVASETAWGNPVVTQALFDKLANAGIKTVRIPVTWLGHIGDAPGYTIDKAWLDRVEQLVGYAEKAGLNAIINIHHDGADSRHWLDIKGAAENPEINAAVTAQIKAMWAQIASRFKDKGQFLIFESFNEIHDGGWGWGANRTDGGKQYRTLNEWNQAFVDTVRATGGNNADRYLAVPSYCTNPDNAVDGSFKLPQDSADNRLIVAVHYYAPVDYSLNDKFKEWGHTGTDVDTWGDETSLLETFGKLKSMYVDKGIPVYIGEMGCVSRDNERAEKFRRYYLEYVCKAARDHNLAPIYWDNGYGGTGREQSGLFDRTTGEYLNNGGDIMSTMVKAVTTDDPDYTLQSVYDNAPI